MPMDLVGYNLNNLAWYMVSSNSKEYLIYHVSYVRNFIQKNLTRCWFVIVVVVVITNNVTNQKWM